MNKRINLILMLSFGILLNWQPSSQAYVERQDTYYVSDEGNVHNTRIGAAIDDAFSDRHHYYHTRSYCRRHPNASGC